MRNAPKVGMVNVNDEFIGFSLSLDFVSEHEWGIAKMKDRFNIKDVDVKELAKKHAKKGFLFPFEIKEGGVSRGCIRSFKKEANKLGKLLFRSSAPVIVLESSKNSSRLNIQSNKDRIVITSSHYSYDQMENTFHQREDRNYAGAWDGSNFCISANKKDLPFFELLVQAEKDNDIYIGSIKELGEGLLILIKSKIPSALENEKVLERATAYQTYLFAYETGIEDEINNSDKSFFALTPRFDDGILKFWLNPRQQNLYNSGLYSVEDLRLWIDDKGPIVKELS